MSVIRYTTYRHTTCSRIQSVRPKIQISEYISFYIYLYCRYNFKKVCVIYDRRSSRPCAVPCGYLTAPLYAVCVSVFEDAGPMTGGSSRSCAVLYLTAPLYAVCVSVFEDAGPIPDHVTFRGKYAGRDCPRRAVSVDSVPPDLGRHASGDSFSRSSLSVRERLGRDVRDASTVVLELGTASWIGDWRVCDRTCMCVALNSCKHVWVGRLSSGSCRWTRLVVLGQRCRFPGIGEMLLSRCLAAVSRFREDVPLVPLRQPVAR